MNHLIFCLAIASVSLFNPAHGSYTMTLDQKMHNLVGELQKVPTLGTGPNHAYAFVSPYCPHCKTIIEHIQQLMQNKQYEQKCTFHILWVSNKEDKPSRAACRYLMGANENGLMMELCQELMEKFNAMEIKDFKDFQFKKQTNFGDVERYDQMLDTIESFVEQSSFEGLPALFCNNKSMMGAPESLNELKDFIDQAANEMQKSSQAAAKAVRALQQAAQRSRQLQR